MPTTLIPFIFHWWDVSSTQAASANELLHCGTDSQEGVFPITTILTCSSLVLTVILPTYLSKLCLLLCSKWHPGLVQDEHNCKKKINKYIATNILSFNFQVIYWLRSLLFEKRLSLCGRGSQIVSCCAFGCHGNFNTVFMQSYFYKGIEWTGSKMGDHFTINV